MRQVRDVLPDGRAILSRVDHLGDGAGSGQARVHRYGEGEKTMDRLRVATLWLGGCAGCHMSFLDLDEALIELAKHIELVYSPIIDVKEFPENVDLCLVEG